MEGIICEKFRSQKPPMQQWPGQRGRKLHLWNQQFKRQAWHFDVFLVYFMEIQESWGDFETLWLWCFPGRHDQMSIHPWQVTSNRPKKHFHKATLVDQWVYRCDLQVLEGWLFTGAWMTQWQVCHWKAHPSGIGNSENLYPWCYQHPENFLREPLSTAIFGLYNLGEGTS